MTKLTLPHSQNGLISDQGAAIPPSPIPGQRGNLFRPSERPVEPPAPLLDHLRFIARAAVRRTFNDPRATCHVERSVLHWVLHWNPITDHPIRQHVGWKAANEAKRCKAAKTEKARRELYGRSWDLLQLRPRRQHRARVLRRAKTKNEETKNEERKKSR